MSSTVFLVPAAILASAFFGFLAAWYTSLINRQRTEIVYLINQVCGSIDRLNEYAYDYWSDAPSGTTLKKVENNILGLLYNISLQLDNLDENLHAFEYDWWQVFRNRATALENKTELFRRFIELHKMITGGVFEDHTQRNAGNVLPHKISQTAEEFKFLIRSRRLRY